ncbi:unnamed protein product [Microthlaspi erraticum]|uniref:Uncharacterized protein n=1 Tax=Microthlaspi erraticum TaxID=1685480 RepID=A0A6D2KR62_9BRAS|nr:unnamed protein product [Microthlaspi erraticum]
MQNENDMVKDEAEVAASISALEGFDRKTVNSVDEIGRSKALADDFSTVNLSGAESSANSLHLLTHFPSIVDCSASHSEALLRLPQFRKFIRD